MYRHRTFHITYILKIRPDSARKRLSNSRGARRQRLFPNVRPFLGPILLQYTRVALSSLGLVLAPQNIGDVDGHTEENHSVPATVKSIFLDLSSVRVSLPCLTACRAAVMLAHPGHPWHLLQRHGSGICRADYDFAKSRVGWLHTLMLAPLP
jgi:hypothetical protein